jgi:hypothetical protein
MNSLNTKDFLESYALLRSTKYPALAQSGDLSHVALSSILTVCIEFGLSFDEIQGRLDRKTSEQKTELENYLSEKAGQ